jgi:acyl carrier protein
VQFFPSTGDIPFLDRSYLVMGLCMDQFDAVFRTIFEDPQLDTHDLSRKNFPDWDSLAQVKIVLAIEEQFRVKISIDEAASVSSAAEFRQLVEKKRGTAV